MDELGLREAAVSTRDEDIVIEVPGEDEKSFAHIRDIISQTARLEFKLLDDDSDYMKELQDKGVIFKKWPIEFLKVFEEALQDFTTKEAMDLLEKADVRSAPWHNYETLFHDPGVLEHVRTMGAPPPVVLVSGAHEAVPPGHLSPFVTGYVGKPFDVRHLIATCTGATNFASSSPAWTGR